MSTKTNLWVDIAIFFAFLVAFEPNLTGITIHEWLSLALAAAFIFHILLHWDWVAAVLGKFFRNLFHTSRLNFLVDLALLVSMVTVMLSGILISRSVVPALGINLNGSQVWRFLHSTSANAALLLVGLHFALHWKWVVNTVKRYILSPIGSRFIRKSPSPSPLPVEEPQFLTEVSG